MSRDERRPRVGRVVAGCAVGALFLWLAFRHVSAPALRDAFRELDPRWLLVSVLLSLVLQVLRAWRWQLELRPLARVAFGPLWAVTSVGYMAINLLPARLGEVVRPWVLAQRTGLRFSQVVGNLIVEKTMDSAVILFFVLLGLVTTADLPAWVRHGAKFPAIAFALMIALVVLVWRRGEAVVARGLGRVLSEGATARLVRVARAMAEGMQVLGDPALVGRVFVASLVLWFVPILSSWVMIRAFGLHAPFNAALVVFIFIGFGTALPQAPGMIGTYQYACILALGLFGVREAEALAYGLVLNAVQLGTLVAQGVVALPFAGVSLGQLARVRDPAPDAS